MSPGDDFIDDMIDTYNEEKRRGIDHISTDKKLALGSGKDGKIALMFVKDIRNECVDNGGPINVYKTIGGDSVCGRCGFVVRLHLPQPAPKTSVPPRFSRDVIHVIRCYSCHSWQIF